MSNETKSKLTFPVTVLAPNGMAIKIRRHAAMKGGKEYVSFVVDYVHPTEGRKQVSRSTIESAQAVASEVGVKLTNSEPPLSTILVNGEQVAYLRSLECAKASGMHIDQLCQIAADVLKVLDGKVSPVEACREWLNRNSTVLAKITIPEAVAKVQAQAASDEKSKARRHELEVLLNQFAKSFNCDASTVTPSALSIYLSGLKSDRGVALSERSKRNHRDVISHLNRWLILHKYLPKECNWMDGVQKYSKLKKGDVTIYTPEELNLIMAAAAKTPTRSKWMVGFCAISAFSTIRHSEVKRLDWKQVELSDKAGESFIEILPVAGTKSGGRRRLIPVNDTLKAWLKTCRKDSGPVVLVNDSYTLLSRLIKSAGVEVRANALRHSSISYAVASTGEVARIADESGNSEKVIRQTYLRRVKPSEAAKWYSVLPTKTKK